MADDKGVNVQADEKLDDDEPIRLEPSLPPEIASPLAPFEGRVPDSPQWFKDAIAREPQRSLVPVDGANIELLTWGEVGKPGLIFVHGNSAHADWWSFIAPYFADDYRVAALSLSGMGASDWRETYSFEGFATEIWECAKAAGLYEAHVKPVYIGHSFGGSQVFYSATKYPERMSACIMVDTGFGGPPTPEQLKKMREDAIREGRHEDARRMGGPPQRTQPNRVYATLEQALTRFRFMPPQVPGNLYIADFIARRSLKRAPLTEGVGPDGSGEGWTWMFDPFLWGKLNRDDFNQRGAAGAAPLAHIYGDKSNVMKRSWNGEQNNSLIPRSAPHVAIPDSEHHIMVDQPLALVAALRAVLAAWPATAK